MGSLIEDRMVIGIDAQDRVGIRLGLRVEGYQDRGLNGQRLQPVHPVGQADFMGVTAPALEIVPARPGGAAAGHEAPYPCAAQAVFGR